MVSPRGCSCPSLSSEEAAPAAARAQEHKPLLRVDAKTAISHDISAQQTRWGSISVRCSWFQQEIGN